MRERAVVNICMPRDDRKCTLTTKRQETRRPDRPHSSPRITRRCGKVVRRTFEGPSLAKAAELCHARFLASHLCLFHRVFPSEPEGYCSPEDGFLTTTHDETISLIARGSKGQSQLIIRDRFFSPFLCKNFSPIKKRRVHL